MNIGELMHKCHAMARAKGFWPPYPRQRNKAEAIALMHSELSEMLEGILKPGVDEHCPRFLKEEVELADLLIRAFDYAEGYGLRLEEAIEEKKKGFLPSYPNSMTEAIAMLHLELSKTLEGIRRPGFDEHCPKFFKEEIGVACLTVQALDYAKRYSLRLEEAIEAKIEYNASRPHKHGKEF